MTPDSVTRLLAEIGGYYERPYPRAQIALWQESLKGELDVVAQAAWRRYRESADVERRPSLGQIRKACDEVREGDRSFGRSNDAAPKHEPSDDEREFVAAHSALLDEVLDWHRWGLVKSQPSDMDAGMFEMDTWRHAGKPPLWSPVLTHAYTGLAEIWHEAHRVRADFCRRYTATLRGQRQQRGGQERADVGMERAI